MNHITSTMASKPTVEVINTGDIFRSDYYGSFYIVACFGSGLFGLVNLRTGSRCKDGASDLQRVLQPEPSHFIRVPVGESVTLKVEANA